MAHLHVFYAPKEKRDKIVKLVGHKPIGETYNSARGQHHLVFMLTENDALRTVDRLYHFRIHYEMTP